jgi:hypothetical protein
MTFEELLKVYRDQKSLRPFVDCYRTAQGKDKIGVQSFLPMRKLAPLMPNVVMMEAENTEEIFYRIVGENIIARLGFNPTGLNMLDYLSEGFSRQLPGLYQTMIQHPCGYYALYENQYDTGQKSMTETFVLPLRKQDNGEPRFTLALHSAHEATGFVPSSGETTLAANLAAGALVDIGAGIPETSFSSDILKELVSSV